MQQYLTEEQSYVREFIPFVDFLADILGPSSEVLLNDLTDLNHSVVAIRNAHVSHRKVGDPATNLALRTMKAGKDEKRDYLANYQGVSNGNYTLRSSTYFLRYQEKIVGMICINTDDSDLDKLQEQVVKVLTNYKHLNSPNRQQLKGGRPSESEPAVEPEHLTTSINDLAKEVSQNVCSKHGVSVDYLKREDKHADRR